MLLVHKVQCSTDPAAVSSVAILTGSPTHLYPRCSNHACADAGDVPISAKWRLSVLSSEFISAFGSPHPASVAHRPIAAITAADLVLQSAPIARCIDPPACSSGRDRRKHVAIRSVHGSHERALNGK